MLTGQLQSYYPDFHRPLSRHPDIPARHIDPSHQLMLSGSNPPEESDTPSHISF
jgi:hypothetical protein